MYATKCRDLLKDPDIRFVGIINEDGQLISGGFKDGIARHEVDDGRLRMFIEFVSKISTRKEYDQSLGPINYIAARRTRVVLISFPFPITKITLLVSAEPTVDIEDLAGKITGAFAGTV